MLRNLIARFLGRDGRAEADVRPDPARANSRVTTEQISGKTATTTATGGAQEFVGRVAGDDDFTGETGADRRAAKASKRA